MLDYGGLARLIFKPEAHGLRERRVDRRRVGRAFALLSS